ncbi:hypothetical protein WA158_005787 [Blastocystis sp. Blastoise]
MSATLYFFGTGAMRPTISRNSIERNILNVNWYYTRSYPEAIPNYKLFSIGKINDIFITHLHGDHVSGLLNLVSSIGFDSLSMRPQPILNIYGPQGLYNFVTQMFTSRGAHPLCQLHIHEMVVDNYEPPVCPEEWQLLYSYTAIYPNQEGVYTVLSNQFINVKATEIEHRGMTVGYVFEEVERPGNIHMDTFKDVMDRMGQYLLDTGDYTKRDIRQYCFNLITRYKQGETLNLPNGQVVVYPDPKYISPPTSGRKIVILGDTCNPMPIASIARNADVIVHESTVGPTLYDLYDDYNPKDMGSILEESSFDIRNNYKYLKIEAEAFNHKHSTAFMAGEFAKEINASELILTHFSTKYSGESFYEKNDFMRDIEDIAKLGFQDQSVYAAYDGFIYSVSSKK